MDYQLKQPVNGVELAEFLGLAYIGENVVITEVAPLSSVGGSCLSFSKTPIAIDEKNIFIAPEDCTVEHGMHILSTNPRLDFIRVLNYLVDKIGFSTYEFQSEIHPTARIGQNVVIEDGCKIGENVVVEHNCVIHSGTIIGNNSRIRSCSSIGGDGFGFERLGDGTPLRFPHLGGVIIGENVEIGSCTTIARGTLSNTEIKNSVKIDNLVHIAHNCVIDEGAFVIACAEVSGGVYIGKNAWIAPNSCTHQKISIGANSLVGLGAVVTKDVPDNAVYTGNPAKKIRDIK